MGDIHTTPLPTANDIVASGQFDDPVRYFRRIQDILDKAAKDPALVMRYERHLATCPACRKVGVCRPALELILPARALDWLKDHAEQQPDAVDVLQLRFEQYSTEALAAIFDEGGPGNTGRWYATAEKVLMKRLGEVQS